MPSSARVKVTHESLLSAIQTISALAQHVPADTPRIEYGSGPGQVPMTPDNAAPGLLVWLFLVTSPRFLRTLDKPENDQSAVPVAEIAKATNLTEDCVNTILDVYRNRKDQDDKSFLNVADALQDYAIGVGYPRGPGCAPASSILALAPNVAVLDSNS